ncbi:unnamed protein product [Owenia fusiformis]|uniref:Cyclic nucleotide-binding domain-containing protein n=1 Tax=Owenia fusiformis TaxID=6347 RepID=A0A8S4QC71_OWEFU|nr:unnamed protein product [Owenia fusiformis]
MTESHSEHAEPTMIMFVFTSCALGALIRFIMKSTILQKLRLPYTVILLLFGSLIGIISSQVPSFAAYTTIVHINPHTLLNVFLPVLVFESAFAMEAHTFLKSFVQIVILAIPGLAIATGLTGLFAMFVFTYEWTWTESMMFGSILSATDPVAVVALLKDLGASKQLGTLIEGESLLNDGAAIVLFKVFLKLATPGMTMAGHEILFEFLQVALGGPAFGLVMGKLTTYWLSKIFNDALTEITITLASTYVTYYIGEQFLKVSGVLAVVVLGVIVSAEKTSISPEVEAFLHRFWEMLAYLANTLIFILVGVVITERALGGITGLDAFYMLALYFAITVIRGITIGFFSPILARIGYGLPWRNGLVMTWGGLRGAVGLALALQVVQDSNLNNERIGNKVFLHTAGIVVLTLAINATTISGLLKVLGMSDISAPKRMAMASAVRHLEDRQRITLSMLKTDRFLADADWDMVEKMVSVQDPYHTLDEEAELENLTYLQRTSTCEYCEHEVQNLPSPAEFKEMENEARLRVLKAQKIAYWKQFEHGMLSREAVRKLVDAAETASDVIGAFINVEELKKTWKVGRFYANIKRRLEMWIMKKPEEEIVLPENKVRRRCNIIARSDWFEYAIFALIGINCTEVIIELVFTYSRPEAVQVPTEIFDGTKTITVLKNSPYFDWSTRVCNYVFLLCYIVEAVIKTLGYGPLEYIKSHWNQFDLLLIFLSVADVIIELTVNQDDVSNITSTTNIFKVVKIFRILRISRVLRLFKAAVPQMIGVINRRINKQLRLGYDVGKGYIFGEEEVRKVVDQMVDDRNIAKELKVVIDKGRLQVIKELGMLQREHPGIAVSVKTVQAIRTILNNMRDCIHEQKGDGLLDEGEAVKLEMMVEERMKRLLSAPATIPPPLPEDIMGNLSWVAKDQRLLAFLKDCAELVHYNHGEVIMREGESTKGVYIIVSGIVRFEGTVIDRTADITESKDSSIFTQNEIYTDYMTIGNVIGELGVLLDRPRTATATSETSVQLYFISGNDMMRALNLFSQLEYRLWRVCAIRLACGILMKLPSFQGWTQEKIKLHLEKSYLVDLHGDQKFIMVDPSFADTLLIQGKGIIAHSRVEVEGPCVLPRNTNKLILVEDDEIRHVILIVPTENAPSNKMVNIEGSTTSIVGPGPQKTSNMCLRHSSNYKVELQRKVSLHQEKSKSRLNLAISRQQSRYPIQTHQLTCKEKLPPIGQTEASTLPAEPSTFPQHSGVDPIIQNHGPAPLTLSSTAVAPVGEQRKHFDI